MTSSVGNISCNSQFSAWEQPSTSEEQNGIYFVLQETNQKQNFIFSLNENYRLSSCTGITWHTLAVDICSGDAKLCLKISVKGLH